MILAQKIHTGCLLLAEVIFSPAINEDADHVLSQKSNYTEIRPWADTEGTIPSKGLRVAGMSPKFSYQSFGQTKAVYLYPSLALKTIDLETTPSMNRRTAYRELVSFQ